MSDEDGAYAWRHAFAYADQHVSTDEAVAYADHYCTLLDTEDVDALTYAPSHGPTFADWREKQTGQLVYPGHWGNTGSE